MYGTAGHGSEQSVNLLSLGRIFRKKDQEDSTCCRQLSPYTTATELMHSRACEPQLMSPCVTVTEGCVPRARAVQEKPLQQEVCGLQKRVAPVHCNWRKPAHNNEDPVQPNN